MTTHDGGFLPPLRTTTSMVRRDGETAISVLSVAVGGHGERRCIVCSSPSPDRYVCCRTQSKPRPLGDLGHFGTIPVVPDETAQ